MQCCICGGDKIVVVHDFYGQVSCLYVLFFIALVLTLCFSDYN